MKSVKYLGFIGLGCALLLTGCGGKNSNKDNGSGKNKTGSDISEKVPKKDIITCTSGEDFETQKFTYEFDSNSGKVIGADMYLFRELPKDATDEQIEKTKSLFEKMICSEKSVVEDCKISITENKLEIYATVKKESFEEDKIETKEDVKKQYEDLGYTCE